MGPPPISAVSLPASAETAIAASGRSAEKLSLQSLQSRMKCDPAGYESELLLLIRHFDSCLAVFQQHAALKSASMGGDPAAAKELGDLTMFLAHVTPSYRQHLGDFPKQLVDLLRTSGHALPPALRRQIAQALILLVNRQMIDLAETLALFMVLQTLGDRELRKLAFLHVVQSIRRMNVKHKNDPKNRVLQNILFTLLQDEQESKAKRALAVLCDLHRRKVWADERTGNAICTACFHKSSKVMIAVLSFLLSYEQNEEDYENEGSSSDEDMASQKPQVVLSREAVYKAHHKGTQSSRKKKQAKLQRVMRSLKKQQRTHSQNVERGGYSPLQHLKDPQVKMMMVKVIARSVGLHRLILLNFYPFLQKYVQPHQQDVTHLLAAAVQACHDMVPPDAVEPLLRQLVNQFVHDRARNEVIAVGLNVVREMCIRMPLLMTEDLLRDLVLYKKSHEKAVSSAARSLITLFRQICPLLLDKKDRGRAADTKARPKAFGEKIVATDVPGAALLLADDGASNDSDNDNEDAADADMLDLSSDMDGDDMSEESENERTGDESDDTSENTGVDCDADDEEAACEEDDGYTERTEMVRASDEGRLSEEEIRSDKEKQDAHLQSKSKKRKISEVIDTVKDMSLQSIRALKKLAADKAVTSSLVTSEGLVDGILSNEDFQRIRELQAKRAVKVVLAEHGMGRSGPVAKAMPVKIPSSEQLCEQRVNPSKLAANIHMRKDKEERLALVKAGREDRIKYASRTAVKQKKSGGLSNRQKERQKGMPLAAKRAKIARSLREKKKKRNTSKQFVGKKAWK